MCIRDRFNIAIKKCRLRIIKEINIIKIIFKSYYYLTNLLHVVTVNVETEENVVVNHTAQQCFNEITILELLNMLLSQTQMSYRSDMYNSLL